MGSDLKLNIEEELVAFIDFVAPNLDVYEQAIFFHLLRRSHLSGTDVLTIGLKSARKEMGFGTGDNSRPMSEGTITRKVQGLIDKGILEKLNSTRQGTVLRVVLPSKSRFIEQHIEKLKKLDIEEIDFFSDPLGRAAILEREFHMCFYCRAKLDENNYVMEHIISRPNGSNGYQNIVAACRACNNKKSEKSAEDHLRNLYREDFLSRSEFLERKDALQAVTEGKLLPVISKSNK